MSKLTTKEYDKFQLFTFNRPIIDGLVKELMESIKENGYFPGKDVLVTQDFTIVDGQNRFEACRRLGVEVPYEFLAEGVDPHKAVIALNANQRRWSLENYIHAWAESGVKCYQDLLVFEAQHKLGVSNSILILFGGNKCDGTDTKRIKAGYNFKLNPKATEIAWYISGCSMVPYHRTSKFVQAVIKLHKVADEKAIKKVKSHIISIPQLATLADYLAAFENIVNRGVRKNKHISFKTGKNQGIY